jgi:putative sigma-54 modulation protein
MIPVWPIDCPFGTPIRVRAWELNDQVLLDFLPDPRQSSRMKFILTTHNVTLTKAIEDHILTRIEKIEHLDHLATSTRVSLVHDKLKAPKRQFSCTMRLAVPGRDLVASDSESDLYAAIDLVTKKMEQQLRKRHSKTKARQHTLGSRSKRSRQAKDD